MRRASSSACFRWPASRSARSSGRGWARCCSTDGSHSPYAPLFGLVGALVAGSDPRGRARGGRRSGAATAPHARAWAWSTGSLGALLTACVALGMVWIAGAVALQTPGTAEPAPRHPAVGDPVQPQHDPAAGRADPQRAARLDPLPEIRGPAADVPPPTAAILRDPQVKRAHRGVVRILGTACGLSIEGSGWVASPGVVVTNAHVVAGEDDTTVEVGGSPDRSSRRTRSGSTRPTTSRSCASRAWMRRRCSTWRPTRAGARRGRSSATRERPVPFDGGPPRRHPDLLVPGRLRTRPGLA